MATDPAPKSVHQAIAAVMADVAAVGIGKDKRNQSQNFDFRSIDNFYDTLGPLFAKHGVFTAPQLEDLQFGSIPMGSKTWTLATVTIRYRVFGPAGDHISVIVCGQGVDGSDKATNKALTAAHKWALTQLFMPPFQGVDDADSETHQPHEPLPINDTLRADLAARLKALGGYPERWKAEKIPTPKALRVHEYQHAVEVLLEAEKIAAAASKPDSPPQDTGKAPSSSPARSRAAAAPPDDEEPF